MELKANQIVQVVGPRGTREKAIVKGITRNGLVLVQIEGYEYVILFDREDIETDE